MTGRAVPEWIGKTPDSKIPDKVQLRIWAREGGRCYLTGKKIMPGDEYDFEHVIALALWPSSGPDDHGNRESNIRLALRGAHKNKTKADRKRQAKSDRIRKRHIGIKQAPKLQGRGFAKPQTKYSRAQGRFINRETGEPVKG